MCSKRRRATQTAKYRQQLRRRLDQLLTFSYYNYCLAICISFFWRLPGQLYTVRYRCSTTMRVDCNNLFMLTFHMLACLFLLDQEYLVLSLFRSFFELILTTGLLHQQKQHVFLLFFLEKILEGNLYFTIHVSIELPGIRNPLHQSTVVKCTRFYKKVF